MRIWSPKNAPSKENEAPPDLSLGMVVFVSPENLDWSGFGQIVGFDGDQVRLKIRNGLMTVTVDRSSVFLQ